MLKIQIMDMLLPWLLKTGGKLLITVLIAVIGYKVIRAIRKGVGRSMEKACLEVTLRKFWMRFYMPCSSGSCVLGCRRSWGSNPPPW